MMGGIRVEVDGLDILVDDFGFMSGGAAAATLSALQHGKAEDAVRKEGTWPAARFELAGRGADDLKLEWIHRYRLGALTLECDKRSESDHAESGVRYSCEARSMGIRVDWHPA